MPDFSVSTMWYIYLKINIRKQMCSIKALQLFIKVQKMCTSGFDFSLAFLLLS